MNKSEIIERLKKIAEHAVHIAGEAPFDMSLDDGIAVHEAIELLEKPIQPNHNAEPGKMVEDTISRQAAIDAVYKNDRYTTIGQRLEALPSVQPIITHEQAIDYLRETGWLQNHDRILTESKVPLKGTWKDYTDEGYVECPFCKSATNCESKEDIDDLHFCFSCGAMLRREEAE